MNKECAKIYKMRLKSTLLKIKEKTERKTVNIYALYRKKAGLTQEKAANKLHISRRQFQKYEMCKPRPPDDIVEKMTVLYGDKMLLWHYAKSHDIFGRFLPDIPEPETNGDLLFQIYAAGDKLSAAGKAVKRLMDEGGGAISGNADELLKCAEKLGEIAASAFMMSLYAEQIGTQKKAAQALRVPRQPRDKAAQL